MQTVYRWANPLRVGHEADEVLDPAKAKPGDTGWVGEIGSRKEFKFSREMMDYVPVEEYRQLERARAERNRSRNSHRFNRFGRRKERESMYLSR